MASAVPLSFATWSNLINNFAIERAAFTGAEMGMLQSLREVPGFLSFAVVLVLLFMREQSLALWSLLILGVGLDHLFFAMAIAVKTYFQKIADPADIASTAEWASPSTTSRR